MSKGKSIAKIAKTSDMSRADYELTRMTYTDLKRACLARGMDFEKASDGSIPRLARWFTDNYELPQWLNHLDEYDEWLEKVLLERGYKKGDAVFHNDLKMSLLKNTDEEGNVTTAKPRLGNKGIAKKEKKKRERVEGTKIFKGTKKALTYECQKNKLTLPDTIKKVIKQFPDANEKSITIWFKRSKNGK